MPQPAASSFDWNDLKYLLACARGGTLAAAGRALGVDQTTVGRRLAALERDLGARLFDRTPDGFVPTATGEQMVELARAIEQGAIDLERTATARDARLEGTVRLATTETLALTFVTQNLIRLHRAHPGIEVEVVIGLPSVSLLRREADLALRVGPRPTQRSLIVRRVGLVRIGLFASPGYLAARPGAERSLAGHDLIGFCDEMAQTTPARMLDERATGARFVLRSNSILAAAAAARAGWGIACMPEFVAHGDPELRGIGELLPGGNPLWLVVHADLQRTPRVRAVMDCLAELVVEAGLAEPPAPTARSRR